MAEFVLRDMCSRAGLAAQFDIASAATSSEELGNPVYPPARRKLAEHGIGCPGKTARQVTAGDYKRYDLIIGMDQANVTNLLHFFGGDPEGKISLLLNHVDPSDTEFYGRDVADPWYTRKFNIAYADIEAGCVALFDQLTAE